MTATILQFPSPEFRARRYGESRYPNWPNEGRAYCPRRQERLPGTAGALVFLCAWWATVGWAMFGGPWR